ncbi:restriction endonuclease subunit S [Candidatus Allofournierella excrementavium]|uniref:restriction endonuclease subunit S n=1 Tax=Candidatus Allofournierella excrementavium TaxID=2838591 RepID=UPI003AF982DC
MSWEKVKFGDLYEVPSRNGLTKPSKVRGTGYKMINMGELFANNRIYDIPMEFVPLTDSEKKNCKVERDDLLFARQSLVLEGAGKCSIIMDVSPMTVFESHLIRIRLNHAKAHPMFYYYYFSSSCSPIKSIVSQCAQAGIRGSDLGELYVEFPPLATQRRIADILSAYDDLIENNRKQIKLLEESAQRLYKEWFVDLRFPGHEHTKIMNGVPEGWGIYRFSDKVDIMSGGTPKTDNPNYYNGTIPFYTPKDSDDAFFAFETITNITEEGLNNCNSRLYPKNTVIITARGTVGKTTLLAVPMAMNQSCYALKSDNIKAPYYLFFALNKEIASLKAMSNGGVFNTIIVKTFDSIHIAIPSNNLITSFETLVTPIMEQIKTKTREIFVLVEARDRLLPKLMSKEVEV